MNPWVSSLWLELLQMWEINHFKWVGRSHDRQVPKDDKRCREVHDTHQYDEGKEMAILEFDVARSNVFNFHSLRSVIITKLKTNAAQM